MKVTAAVPKVILNSKAFKSMKEYIQTDLGIPVDATKTSPNYGKKLQNATDMITWGVKRKTSNYLSNDRNVLFVENGLYNQNSGFYCDDMGYFSDSSIVQKNLYKRKPTENELKSLKNHTMRFHRIDYNHQPHYNPDGPILICLQLNGDASMLHNFPLCKGNKRNDFFLDLCKKNLPKNRDVLVRYHPRDKIRKTNVTFPKNWSFEKSGNRFMAVAQGCSALVVVNSTVATESLCLGIPVATFGQSTFYGSGVTLDCSHTPSVLKGLFDFEPGWDTIDSYLCSVLRSQLPYTSGLERILKLDAFNRFCEKLTRKYKKPPQKRKKIYPGYKLEEDKVVERLCDLAIIGFDGTGHNELGRILSKDKKIGRVGIFKLDDLDVDKLFKDDKCKKILVTRGNLFHSYVDHKMGRGKVSRCNIDAQKIKRWMVDTREIVSELSNKCDIVLDYDTMTKESINDLFNKLGVKRLSYRIKDIHYDKRNYQKVVPNYKRIISEIDDLIGLTVESKKVATRILICRRCKKPKIDKSSKVGKCKHCGAKNNEK